MAKQKQWAHSLAEARRRGIIHATLPSGLQVDVRSLTLDDLVAVNGLPDDLVRIALLEISPGGVGAEIARELKKADKGALDRARKISEDQNALRDRLVLAAVVQPKLTAKDLPYLDSFDKVMVAEIAQHKLEFDAAGRRIGPEPVSTFRLFGEKHGCPADCPHCEAARMELSAVHG